MQYPQVQPVDPLGEYLKNFFKSNAPRIARFFYDMYKITDEYIGNVSQEIIQNPVNYCPPPTNPQGYLDYNQQYPPPPQVPMPQPQQIQQHHNQPYHQPSTVQNKPSAVALPQSKRIKKDKKPLNERKPISAYILYSSVMRHELKQKHPNETHSELMKIAGQMWNQLPEQEQREWKEKAIQKAIDQNQDSNYLRGAGQKKKKKAPNQIGGMKRVCNDNNGPLGQMKEMTSTLSSGDDTKVDN